ncbi:quaternary amine ABC transporter ATP-binding protein [Chromohalobacter israelensis]|jgi:glycine betaine/proline transport system ATP-binding protein|uniref:Quaternary amine transport ATP-binding protein n=1 Tax=Chromohalobacter israelensis (strain ATCC BAA-138 / DSM 3043 / CIP 106854 / NCIMB 13768 / 1H11) TaxID=290398 RepID=Q1QWA3_CHRI1|nr:glycine betaine/L-proline ABC transporter ATP-binding protein [Chromohalobacter salexigens]ABE59255.1 glycine betaine/L-proline transport ATP binding subunit [Chromohalobacter salexigens DSM 3043]MDO0946601.1 glycine betaine/L-proline ABC transporter ATP-binding protein [Chromohalobacter salexigens]NWO56657.1 glycine betaine/L-proline ABC transporter ATP-binding protein [Chromohalobacter salexigens]PWW40651.1 glycine betaine/proline transport system ATP-binding protein [Chromohalobacter sale
MTETDETNESNIKIQVRGLSKVFGSQPKKALELRNQGKKRPEILEKTGQTLGLSNIDFDVREGELLVIMGLSGSGKSTLIRCLNRLIEPTEGDIIIDGQNIPKLNEKELLECRRRHFSMVFQNFALFPHRTVQENAEYGLEVRGIEKSSRVESARNSLKQVGLEGWEDAYPNQLSGGMQQRVGLARALANDSTVMLMDEAFSALDPLIRKDMQQELIELQHRMKKTTIFITHDLDEAISIGDRIILLKDGEIVQSGTPEEILTRPADDYVARFVEGVDMSRVLTATSAMRPVRATARDSDGPRTVLRKMSDNGLDSIYVIGRDRTLLGIVGVDDVDAAAKAGKDTIHELIHDDFPKAGPDEPMNNLFAMFSEKSYPIAIVDENQRLLGVVVKGAVLEQLAEAGEH